jgi:ABC-type antimicrobial peptide transport system permease subunit
MNAPADLLALADFSNLSANIGLAVLIAVVGGVVGILLVLATTWLLPHVINRLTPDIDEAKEVARGNVAVAEYFGRVAAAAIIGVSVVIAAAVVAGILAVALSSPQ